LALPNINKKGSTFAREPFTIYWKSTT